MANTSPEKESIDSFFNFHGTTVPETTVSERKITFGKYKIFSDGGDEYPRHEFPFNEDANERYGAPLLNDPFDSHPEQHPVAKAFKEAIQKGEIMVKTLVDLQLNEEQVVVEDALSSQEQGTRVRLIVSHVDVDGKGLEFDGWAVAEEPSHEHPIYLLSPDRFQIQPTQVQE